MVRTPPPDSPSTDEEPRMRLEGRDPRTLQPHPQNFRKHSSLQRSTFSGFLNDVGWVAPLIFNEQTGRLIDGHMRREEAIERNLESVPVVIVDLPPHKESEVLYFFDRIGAMAMADENLEAAVAAQIQTDEEALAALLAGQADPLSVDDPDDETSGEDLRHLALVPGESFNYVVLLFKTDIDWLAAQDHFALERVADPLNTNHTGVGRIVDGGAYLKRALGRV